MHFLRFTAHAALVTAQFQVSLEWPFSFVGGYSSNGTLGKNKAVTFAVSIPQFPTQVNLTGLYSPISVSVQCWGCKTGLVGPCMTILSGNGPNSTCDQKYCDSKRHTCWEALPTSTSSASTYEITVANENIFTGLNYSIDISTGCSNASRVFDKNVCAPVLDGNYPTACVFQAGSAADNKTIFGVDGCNCVANASDNGCSSCWDGTLPSQCDVVDGAVQVCGSYCNPAQPP